MKEKASILQLVATVDPEMEFPFFFWGDEMEFKYLGQLEINWAIEAPECHDI